MKRQEKSVGGMPKLVDKNISPMFGNAAKRCWGRERERGGAVGGTSFSRLFLPFTRFLCVALTEERRKETQKKDGHVIGYLANDQYSFQLSNAWFINRSHFFSQLLLPLLSR